MSAKVKIMLISFIALVSIAAWSFAEDVQGQAANSSKEVNTTVKPEVKTKETKTTKAKKPKKHHKSKKTKKDADTSK